MKGLFLLLLCAVTTFFVKSQSNNSDYLCSEKESKLFHLIDEKPLTINDIEVEDYLYFDSSYLKSCLQELNIKAIPSNRKLARVDLYRALIYYRLYENDSCNKYLDLALSNNKKASSKFGIFETSLSKAMLELRLNKINSYKQFIKQAYAQIDTSKKPLLYANIMCVESAYLEKTGELDEALTILLKSYNLCKNQKDTNLTIAVLNYIGNIYTDNFSLDEAEFYIKKGLSLGKKIDRAYIVAIFENNLANIYLYKKKYQLAIKTYKKALQTFQTINHYSGIYSCYSQLGSIYSEIGEKQAAYDCFKKSIDYSKLSGIKSHVATAYARFSLFLMNENKLDEAEKQLLAAKNLENEITNNILIIDIYELLSTLYFKRQEYKKAYEYKDLFVSLSDSIENIQVKKNIQEITKKYEVELKESENKRLKNELKYSNSRVIFISLCALLFFLGLILTVYYRNKAKNTKIVALNNKIKADQEAKKQAEYRIEELKKEIINKNLLIKEIEEQPKIINIEDDFAKKMIEKLSNDKSWAQFMIEFELLHKNFFISLSKKYSQLTQGDLRLLSLLKLNLNDQEIADLLYIEYNSVRRIKNRLKNKLEIKNFQEILFY